MATSGEEAKRKMKKKGVVCDARLGKQGKHFTLRYDQSIYVVSLN